MTSSNVFIRSLCLRIKLGLKVIWRDTGSRYSFLTVFVLVGFWLVTEKLRMLEDGEANGLSGNPNNNILIGVYTGSLQTCASRIALIEYLIEKRKKMFSFLYRLGMTKTNYYSFHILWNFVISLILMVPFVMTISYLLPFEERNTAQVMLAVSLGTLANSLYIMCMALFFYSEITGLNVIGTVNFAISIATSMIPKDSPFTFLMYSNPQSQLVKLLERYALDPPQAKTFSLNHYLGLFGLKILVFGLLFILIENISKNEYGYYNEGSICRKKRKPVEGQEERSFIRRDLELEMQMQLGGDSIFQRGIMADQEKDEEDIKFDDVESNGNKGSRNGTKRIESNELTVMRIKDIKKGFGTNSVLESVNFDLLKGEILCLLGPNGAGKSTLFNIILGNIEPDEGFILQPLNNKRISYCPQHDMGWEHLTVQEHFELILAVQEDQEALAGRNESVKNLAMLGNHWGVLCKNLSGGYKRRLTLAMALLCNSDIILMDEPTTALDMEIRYNMMKGISKAREDLGTTILYTTHHLEDAENFSDNIIILSKGKIILRGSIEELRNQFNLVTIKLYGLDTHRLDEIRNYINREIMHETELVMEGINSASIRLVYDDTMRLANHVRYFETELGLTVDLKQTSLEDVYVMDGEFDNYSSIDSIGRVNLDDCWKKLVTCERTPTFAKSFCLMLKKSKPRLSRLHHRIERYHLLDETNRRFTSPFAHRSNLRKSIQRGHGPTSTVKRHYSGLERHFLDDLRGINRTLFDQLHFYRLCFQSYRA